MRRKTQQRGIFRRFFFMLLLVGLVIYISQSDLFQINWQLPFNKTLEEEIQDVTGLHPIVASKQEQLVHLVREKGIPIIITEGYRSEERQEELYQQGRTANGQIVTSARGGESYHNYGLAIDFAIKVSDDKVIWDMEYDGNGNGKSDWMEIVEIAKELGFEWGGDWVNFPDYPHLQYDFGYSIAQLKRGKRPPGYEVSADLEANEE